MRWLALTLALGLASPAALAQASDQFAPGLLLTLHAAPKDLDEPLDKPVTAIVDDNGPPWSFSVHRAHGLDWFEVPPAYTYEGWYRAEQAGRHSFNVQVSVPQFQTKLRYKKMRGFKAQNHHGKMAVLCRITGALQGRKLLDTVERYVYDAMVSERKSLQLGAAFGAELQPGYHSLRIGVACLPGWPKGSRGPMFFKLDLAQVQVLLTLTTPGGTVAPNDIPALLLHRPPKTTRPTHAIAPSS